MKLFIKIVIIAFLLFAAAAGGGIFYLSHGLEAGKTLAIDSIDLATVNNGVYEGEYKAGRWSNKVKVSIENNKISNIDILDDVTFAKPEVSAEIIAKVIEAQNTNVDIVSGATVSSKAYLKAIENALKNNIRGN